MNYLSNQSLPLPKRVAISDLGLALVEAEIQVSVTRAAYVAASAADADAAWEAHEAAEILHRDATRKLRFAANEIAALATAAHCGHGRNGCSECGTATNA